MADVRLKWSAQAGAVKGHTPWFTDGPSVQDALTVLQTELEQRHAAFAWTEVRSEESPSVEELRTASGPLGVMDPLQPTLGGALVVALCAQFQIDLSQWGALPRLAEAFPEETEGRLRGYRKGVRPKEERINSWVERFGWVVQCTAQGWRVIVPGGEE